MNPASLLAKAPKAFDDLLDIQIITPKKIKDTYGYQYLIKTPPKNIRGSIHKESFFEKNTFGEYRGNRTILSTSTPLNLGDLVTHNGTIYAIENQTSFNKVMDLNHYSLVSLYDYYKEFILDSEVLVNRVLGANSMRFWLGLKLETPLISSLFEPNLDKYISVNVYSTQTRSTPYIKGGFIEQYKQDRVELLAVGLDTYELQKAIFDLQNLSSEDFSIADFPSWGDFTRYDKAFDLKANLQKMDLMVNYKIITNKKLENYEKLIKSIGWDFIYINKRR